ncbi:MAG TPA: PGPGW domain-containing protein [Edaphobacter sp.]|nr:PGPGW domain-containing protein [Edaphobacter sp.]
MSEPPPERSRWIRITSGWFLLGTGIAGCVLPIIPGIPLALAGLLILSRDYAWARSLLRKVKRKAVFLRRKARARQTPASLANAKSG